MTDAFFVPDGDAWVATVHTRGPWSPAHQHGGPPAALIAHLAEAAEPEMAIARITVDFLRPVPIDRLRVRLEPLRDGAKVRRRIGLLLHGDAVVAHAVITLAWRDPVAVKPAADTPPLPPPDARSTPTSRWRCPARSRASGWGSTRSRPTRRTGSAWPTAGSATAAPPSAARFRASCWTSGAARRSYGLTSDAPLCHRIWAIRERAIMI